MAIDKGTRRDPARVTLRSSQSMAAACAWSSSSLLSGEPVPDPSQALPGWTVYRLNVRPDPAKAERDVFVLSLDSGRDVAVVQNPADDDVLGWFPEGERILMASDRGGTTGIWAARVADGPGSEPVLVRPDTGAVASRDSRREATSTTARRFASRR